MANKSDEAVGRKVEAAAAQAGIAIPDACRAAVIDHYKVLAGHAARVMAAPSGDEDEPAPVFRP